jgi:integrase
MAEKEFLRDMYGCVGIRLVPDGTPLEEAPPFGGTGVVSWTDTPFAEIRWLDRVPNPSHRWGHVSFEGIPDHHAWTGRFFLWALENAETAGSKRGRTRPRSGAAARTHMRYFRALVGHMQAIGRVRLMDLTQQDLQEFFVRYCGLAQASGNHCDEVPEGKQPLQVAVAQQLLSTLRRLHDFGPGGDFHVPDGLAFNPEPCLAEFLSHPDLAAAGGTPELDEDVARKLTNAAILWVEQYAVPLADLRRIVAGFEAWMAQSGVEGKEKGMLVVRYLDGHPHVLEAYKALRRAFPEPLDAYFQQYRGWEPAGVSDQAVEAIDRLKRREISDIRALNDATGYRVLLTAAGIAVEGGLATREMVLANSGLRKAFEAATSDIRAVLAAKRSQSKSVSLPEVPACTPDDIRAYNEFRRAPEQLAALDLLMTGMCYAVFAVFNGWRMNEILSVVDGDVVADTVGHEMGSAVRKTSIEPDAVTYRPVPPIVVAAAAVLSQVNGAHFDGDDRQLFRNTLGRPANAIYVEAALRLALRQVDVAGKVGTHQFRRFFVYFYLRRFKGNVDALRLQFRHVSRNMIWAYARDAANAQHLAREEKALALEIVQGIVHGKGFSSRHVAQDIRAQYRAMNLPPKEAEAWLRRALGDKFSAVHPSEFGYCLFQRGDVGAACEAKTEPVLARAAPETCGGCKFQVTGDENVEFWQTIALLHQEIIECDLHVPMLKEASRAMLKTCQGILTRHGMLDAAESEPDMETADE